MFTAKGCIHVFNKSLCTIRWLSTYDGCTSHTTRTSEVPTAKSMTSALDVAMQHLSVNTMLSWLSYHCLRKNCARRPSPTIRLCATKGTCRPLTLGVFSTETVYMHLKFGIQSPFSAFIGDLFGVGGWKVTAENIGKLFITSYQKEQNQGKTKLQPIDTKESSIQWDVSHHNNRAIQELFKISGAVSKDDTRWS